MYRGIVSLEMDLECYLEMHFPGAFSHVVPHNPKKNFTS